MGGWPTNHHAHVCDGCCNASAFVHAATPHRPGVARQQACSPATRPCPKPPPNRWVTLPAVPACRSAHPDLRGGHHPGRQGRDGGKRSNGPCTRQALAFSCTARWSCCERCAMACWPATERPTPKSCMHASKHPVAGQSPPPPPGFFYCSRGVLACDTGPERPHPPRALPQLVAPEEHHCTRAAQSDSWVKAEWIGSLGGRHMCAAACYQHRRICPAAAAAAESLLHQQAARPA